MVFLKIGTLVAEKEKLEKWMPSLTIGFSPFSFFFFERNLRLKMLQGFMGLDYVVLMQRLIEWKVVIKRVFKEAWVAWFVGEGQAVYL